MRTALAPDVSHAFEILGAAKSAFRDRQNLFPWDQRQQRFAGAGLERKTMDVAIGDADEFGACGQRLVKLGLGMDLDQRIERNRRGPFDKLGELFAEQTGRQDHRIRASQTGFEHLIGIDHDVLREDGNLDRVMNRGKIRKGA